LRAAVSSAQQAVTALSELEHRRARIACRAPLRRHEINFAAAAGSQRPSQLPGGGAASSRQVRKTSPSNSHNLGAIGESHQAINANINCDRSSSSRHRVLKPGRRPVKAANWDHRASRHRLREQ
jgi:hypothetical protein